MRELLKKVEELSRVDLRRAASDGWTHGSYKICSIVRMGFILFSKKKILLYYTRGAFVSPSLLNVVSIFS